MGIRVGSVLFIYFFIFACFKRVLGLLLVSFSLFCFVFSMFKDRTLFTMYQHICSWKYYDMVVSRVGIRDLHVH